MPRKTISLNLSGLFLEMLLVVVFMTGCSGVTALPVQIPTATVARTTSATPTSPSGKNAAPTTSVKLQTYSCDSFSVGYPDPWQVDIGRSNQVELSGISKDEFGIVAQSAPSKTAEEELASILVTMNDEYSNFQPVDIQPAVNIGGQNWRQVTWTGTDKNSGLDFKGRETVINYNGHQYIMAYEALASDFGQDDTQYFQIMQQSFAFK